MTKKNDSTEAQGPYTPLETPFDVGQESGGEFQWNRSTAEPQTKEEK